MNPGNSPLPTPNSRRTSKFQMTANRQRRRGRQLILVATLPILASPILGQQGQPPRFRTSVDVVRLDVSVLDRDRRPVRGLTREDFTVLVDGEPQEVVALTEVEATVPVKGSAPWMRDVAPDVTTNELRDPRLFLIIMDDVLVPFEPATLQRSKEIARALVDRLGPGDLASVIFTANNRNAVDFTADRVKLLAAIDTFRASRLHWCMELLYSTNTLRQARESLAQMPGRRSSIVYISVGPAIRFEQDDRMKCFEGFDLVQGQFLLQQEVNRGSGGTHLSNVRIYGVSPRGLVAPGPRGTGMTEPLGNEFLRAVANSSGGLAIVNTNAPQHEVMRILQENSSYYLVGFRPTYPVDDGRIRRIQIRVGRKDVEVQPSSRSFKAAAPEPPRAAVPATTRALSGLIPQSDVPLRLSVGAFAASTTGRSSTAAVTIAVGLTVERDDVSGEPESVQIEVRVFDPEGRKEFDSATHEMEVSPGGSRPVLYDVLSRFDLKPGRYAIRASAHNVSRDRSGSVYADITVPNYPKEAFSLSHVVVSSSAARVAPAGVVDGVLPLLPTTRREFWRGERVQTLARVYQGGKDALAPASLHVLIVNAANETVFERKENIQPAAFNSSRAFDYVLRLPTDTLAPGEYALRIDVAGSRRDSGRRGVRFRIAG